MSRTTGNKRFIGAKSNITFPMELTIILKFSSVSFYPPAHHWLPGQTVSILELGSNKFVLEEAERVFLVLKKRY